MRDDWVKCKIGDITVKSNKTSREKENIEDVFEYIDISTVDNTAFKLKETKLLSWNDAPSRAQQIVDTNDILFSTVRPYLKNIAFVPNDSHNRRIASTGFCVLKPFKIILPKFLFYFVCYDKTINEISKYQTGTSYPAVRDSDIFSIDIPLPPFPEQRAIVKKLESLFSSLDAGVADFKKAQQQLKIYRQAVLKKAFEGEFEEVKFKELGNAIDPQPSHRTPPVDNNGIPFVSIKDIVNNKLELSRARLVSKQILEEHLNRYTLVENDFIIGKIGTIGNPIKVTLPQNYTLSANVVLIQPRKINPCYLYYYFKSPDIEQQFNSGKRATTQAAFGIQKVRDLIVRYPQSSDQQRRIVLDIDSRLSVCDFMEQNIKDSLVKSEALRQSILKKAFEGKLLTEQELAECRKAPDYEPASLLLERIKAEQKEAKPEKKAGYRKEKVSL